MSQTQRSLRLQAQAEEAFRRLKHVPDRAEEAAVELYAFAASPDNIVFEAYLAALDSHALRIAALTENPRLKDITEQIIIVTEGHFPDQTMTLEQITATVQRHQLSLRTVRETFALKGLFELLDTRPDNPETPLPPRG